MVEATKEEYQAAIVQARDKRIMESTRSQDIIWSTCGKEIAWRTTIFKHGKVIQDLFMVAPEYKTT